MKMLDWLKNSGGKVGGAVLPPPRNPDPEIVASALTTSRILSRADAVREQRRRLNLELSRAEDVIRESRDARTDR